MSHSPSTLLPSPALAAGWPNPAACDGEHERLAWLERAVRANGMLPVPAAESGSARRAVQEMNNLAGESIAEWGEGEVGCGLRLTYRGRRLAVALVALRQEQDRMLERFGEHFADDLRLLDRVTVRTSARNQFFCRVEHIAEQGIQDRVTLRLPGGQALRASVTRNSAQSLGLAPGQEAVALIKASSMLLVGCADSEDYSDYNRLCGRISRLQRDADMTEVCVELGAGVTAVAVMANALAANLSLGANSTLAFRPSAVILGVVA